MLVGTWGGGVGEPSIGGCAHRLLTYPLLGIHAPRAVHAFSTLWVASCIGAHDLCKGWVVCFSVGPLVRPLQLSPLTFGASFGRRAFWPAVRGREGSRFHWFKTNLEDQTN